MPVEAAVRVEGADKALRALRTMEPSVAKSVGQQISKIGAGLAAEAQALTPKSPPVSGWVATSGARGSRGGAGWPAWVPVQSSYRRRGMSVIVTTRSSIPAIASFAESLGRGHRVATESGRRLVEMAQSRWSPIVKSGKKEGRVARGAIARNYPQIMADLKAAVDKAVTEVNRRMP
jgi:hypothetical protein